MGNILLYNILLPLTVSFSGALFFTYAVRNIALRLRWISIPRDKRWNKRHVALMGGIAVFAAFIITFLIFEPLEYGMVGVGGIIMFMVGVCDDRFEIKPTLKFLFQFLAASVLIISGYSVNSTWPFWVAIPVTYLWIVGITNAFNLLDNVDGLAAGIAVIVSIVFAGLAFKLNLFTIASIALILAGASGGFLVFNYNPATIFMGDCGSLFIGYVMAALPLILEPKLTSLGINSILPVLVSLTIIPIFDTTLVTCVRLFKGRSPSQGGSDHSSHRLVFAGLSEKNAVFVLYGISIFFGANILLFYPNMISLFNILFTLSILGIFLFGLYLSRLDVYKNERLSTVESFIKSVPAYFKQKLQLAVIIVDIIIVIAAFTLAHFIRFEHWSLPIHQAVVEVLPGVIVIKIILLASLGVYKSVWQYAGVEDLMRLFIATFSGSVFSGIFAWIYTGGYLSVSVFAIDWLLFLFLLAASRFAFKALRRLLAIPANGGKNALIYGAGDAGWLALSEIRQNNNLHIDPVGFIDDSPYKQKGHIQGLKVLGTQESISRICNQYQVEEMLVCIRDLSPKKKRMICHICAENDIACKEFIPLFNKVDPMEISQQKFTKLQY